MHTEAWIWNCCLFTCSRINTDVAHPPKIRTSPGEVVQQAVCHIRVMGLLKPKVSKCHSSLWKTLVPIMLLYLVTSHKLLLPWPKSEKQRGKKSKEKPWSFLLKTQTFCRLLILSSLLTKNHPQAVDNCCLLL